MRPAITAHKALRHRHCCGNDLFLAEMLPDMLPDTRHGFLHDDECPDLWLTCVDQDAAVVGFCHAVPEPLTDGAWTMLALVITPAQQGGGVRFASGPQP